jgi:hypothetical protein
MPYFFAGAVAGLSQGLLTRGPPTVTAGVPVRTLAPGVPADHDAARG